MNDNMKIAKELIKLAKQITADDTSDDNPKVYVGTYAKYNNGDLSGEWVDLTNYSDYDDFLEYCAELHSDEEDPEFMFQDYQNFPEEYYGESKLDEELWDYIEKINDYDKDLVDTILENGYDLDDVENFNFYPNCNDKADFAEIYIDETGGLENLDQKTLEAYFDYESYGRDLAMDITMIEYDGGYLIKYY